MDDRHLQGFSPRNRIQFVSKYDEYTCLRVLENGAGSGHWNSWLQRSSYKRALDQVRGGTITAVAAVKELEVMASSCLSAWDQGN